MTVTLPGNNLFYQQAVFRIRMLRIQEVKKVTTGLEKHKEENIEKICERFIEKSWLNFFFLDLDPT